MCMPLALPRDGVTMMPGKSARIQRSRQWKNQDGSPTDVNSIASSTSSASSAPGTPIKKSNNQNRRRRSRPSPNKNKDLVMKPHHQHRDDSSTASTVPSSDDSFSSDSCSSPQRKRIQTTRKNSTTAKNKKSWKNTNNTHRNKSPSKKLNIVSISEITEDEKSKYVALDAEMVGIGPGGHESALARISLVNWEGEVVFDTMVQVTEPVTDYRTFVSGITEEDLQGDNVMTFPECQRKVEELIHDKIVVGHGLKNDFKVLKLSHPWFDTRDTAKYEAFMKPSSEDASILVAKKLKVLAKDKLGMTIQKEGMSHCPVEDAVAAMELYKKHRVKWEKSVQWKMERTKQIVGQ